jgi:hypothetical protein
VFGEVIEGLEVLEAILASHVDEPGNDFGGAPDPPVVVNSVTIMLPTPPPIQPTANDSADGGGDETPDQNDDESART